MSLLPDTSGDLERELESLGDRYNFDSPICDLWNHETCPEPLLIYLAWALSVDNWEESWSESVKRNVCGSSLDVHRMKGTSKSLKDAVNAIGFDVGFEYWHQNNNIPKGTFTAKISTEDKQFSDPTFDEIIKCINENKRGTLHLNSAELITTSKGALSTTQHVKVGELIKIRPADLYPTGDFILPLSNNLFIYESFKTTNGNTKLELNEDLTIYEELNK